MSKKTKKSRVTTGALGSLAGIATIASVASVIACGHRSKENAPSTQQVDTSHINLSGVKVFDNGEVQGLPQLPKGVHLDYFLDGQTKVVHNVGDLGQLQSGATLHLQLGADTGYALKGDLHKTSVLIDHHVTSAPAEQDQVLRTLVKVNSGDLAPITVLQGADPALPTIVGGTWVLKGASDKFASANYQPGDVVRFTLQAASKEYRVPEPAAQLRVTIHGVITDDTYKAFSLAKIHILPKGHKIGLPPVPAGAHWHYAAQVAGRAIVLDKDGNFPAGTTLTVGATVTIAVVADQYYEFSGAIPEKRDFTVEAPRAISQVTPRTIVKVNPKTIKPITVLQGEAPALPTILGGTWVLEGGGTFDSNNYESGTTVTLTLQPESEEYAVLEPVQLRVTIIHGVITNAAYQLLAISQVRIFSNGHITGLPSIPADGHWHYVAKIAGKGFVIDKDGNFPAHTVLTVGTTVTITVEADQYYEFSGSIPTPVSRDYTVEAATSV